MNLDDFKKKGYVLIDGKLVQSKSKKSKYRNTKSVLDDITFDSKKEKDFYSKLCLMKKGGEINDFRRQVKFEINVNGHHIANYFLDFEVIYPDSKVEYIDIKGQDSKTKKWITTGVFSLKKKLVEAIYGITIKMM